MKKFVIFILAIFMCLPIAEAKQKLNNKPAKPAGISAKHVKPSWMTEREINVSQTNPYTGKTSKHYWVKKEIWDEQHQYLSTLSFTTSVGLKYTECPYRVNNIVHDIKAAPLGSFDFNVMYTFGGNLKNCFGVFAGCDISAPALKSYNYSIYPENLHLLMDYRAGFVLMKYAGVGFQVEYNNYFKEYVQDVYRVDPYQYGLYIIGLYRVGNHVGINASFSYIFNKQWNIYNQTYNRELYNPNKSIMTDFALHFGLVYYIQVR